ncbi:MAG: NPCBM/NEW2 domain-containing protein, partial [Bacteroidales bacterium]|nr:NPCBM/NEW2 domain-containing protein [Bacteroidales bacterium]
PILIAGVEYLKGLGMHANAEVHYPLCDWDYDQFMTYIGHDDEANGGDGVIFKVVLDYDTVFTSDAKKWGDPAELIKISVASGVDTLRLLIDMIGNDGYDHADWADAILYKIDTTAIDGPDELIPTTTQLIGNYPNPFNPSTTIAYQLHKPAKVKIEIFNIIGQKVKTLVNAPQGIGNYKANWNTVNDAGGKVASGIYLYRLEANNFTQVKKMILIR